VAVPFDASRFVGVYSGTGVWVDIASDSKQYRISQEIKTEANRLLVAYKHDFFQEGNVIDGTLVFEFGSQSIFTVGMNGKTVGHGYLFDDYLHFNLQLGEMFIEVSYQSAGKAIRVRGSTNKNSQGRFIAWREELA
jgi:hypothetical protein